MKKLLSLLIIAGGVSITAHAQDSMNKKVQNPTDKMVKKMDNTSDKMNKKIENKPKQALPVTVDSLSKKNASKARKPKDD